MDEPKESSIEIKDDDVLYRRIFRLWRDDPFVMPTAYMIPKTEDTPDPELSVDLARLTTPAKTLSDGPPGFGLGELTVGDVRELGFTVRYKPDLERGNLAHCVIEGVKTIEDCEALANRTRVHTRPTNRPKPRPTS